jgi:NhaA family Na+:H+ antiporter
MQKVGIPMYNEPVPEDQISPESLVSKVIANTAFQNFYTTISNGGFLLLAASIAALIWSNISPDNYAHFWHKEFTLSIGGAALSHSLAHWVNDGLMTLFFFTVGLEIKREMLVGGLSDPRRAALPVAAAVGGMIFPALIYFIFNNGSDSTSGWGIPIATDIAFSLAILSTLGKRIPFGIRIFLTAFAIADDLGAILVIALFYTPEIHFSYLAGGVMICAILFMLNRFWVRNPLAYLVLGAILWYMVAHSGLHATITGVVVSMFIPSKSRYNTDVFMKMVQERLEQITCEGDECGYTIMVNRTHLDAVHSINIACSMVETPLQRMEHAMEPWVAYLILPLFALANAGVVFGALDLGEAVFHPVTLGVTIGLAFGKPIGVTLFTWLATKILRIDLITGATWPMILGVGFLGGIGFTMSLFISALSFSEPVFQEYAKIGIIAGSFISGVCGYLVLRVATVNRASG